ncbi:hypothetical protein BU14_1013s0002 [Porphyra umbilicalis]|uniref:Uncharacterized protein n=1 Tax=Porphyra umbilicalis TaxID=2786 RepID=A0A1X6NNH7_PORUM|nr:hypothetical protein BU14_1013s0002 [Porphyra umbilicalis]|eukprot:OSX69913.1 hypothetical protein BU14_1013s0002 [Porphyra umbilicalis]
MGVPTMWGPPAAGAPHRVAPIPSRRHNRVDGGDTRPRARPTPPPPSPPVSTCGQSAWSGCGTSPCTSYAPTSCTPSSSCNTCRLYTRVWWSIQARCGRNSAPPLCTCRSGCRSGRTSWRARTCRAPPPSPGPRPCRPRRRRWRRSLSRLQQQPPQRSWRRGRR